MDELEKEIKLFVNSIYGYSWNEVLNKLRKYFKWEYEDY
ncbi:Imm8 family immunity protein [Avibacterium paragallinarum]